MVSTTKLKKKTKKNLNFKSKPLILK